MPVPTINVPFENDSQALVLRAITWGLELNLDNGNHSRFRFACFGPDEVEVGNPEFRDDFGWAVHQEDHADLVPYQQFINKILCIGGQLETSRYDIPNQIVPSWETIRQAQDHMSELRRRFPSAAHHGSTNRRFRWVSLYMLQSLVWDQGIRLNRIERGTSGILYETEETEGTHRDFNILNDGATLCGALRGVLRSYGREIPPALSRSSNESNRVREERVQSSAQSNQSFANRIFNDSYQQSIAEFLSMLEHNNLSGGLAELPDALDAVAVSAGDESYRLDTGVSDRTESD